MKMCNLQQLCSQELGDVTGGNVKCMCMTASGHMYGIEGIFNRDDCGVECCFKLDKDPVFGPKVVGDPVMGYAFSGYHSPATMGGCIDKPEGTSFSAAVDIAQWLLNKNNNDNDRRRK